MKRLYFFATPKDAAGLLEKFEESASVKYVKSGQFDNPNPPIHLSADQIPNLGTSSSSTGSTSTSYLVSFLDTQNNIEKFINTDGDARWMIYNGNTEGSVVLTMAGLWGEGVVLPGNMSTLHETGEAQQIMRKFSAALKKFGFVKIDMWWVSPEALEMLKNGKRLATAAYESPPEYDLPLPEDLQNK